MRNTIMVGLFAAGVAAAPASSLAADKLYACEAVASGEGTERITVSLTVTEGGALQAGQALWQSTWTDQMRPSAFIVIGFGLDPQSGAVGAPEKISPRYVVYFTPGPKGASASSYVAMGGADAMSKVWPEYAKASNATVDTVGVTGVINFTGEDKGFDANAGALKAALEKGDVAVTTRLIDNLGKARDSGDFVLRRKTWDAVAKAYAEAKAKTAKPKKCKAVKS